MTESQYNWLCSAVLKAKTKNPKANTVTMSHDLRKQLIEYHNGAVTVKIANDTNVTLYGLEVIGSGLIEADKMYIYHADKLFQKTANIVL